MDPDIRSYYDRRPEETRLSRGVSQLEAARTKDLIRRFAPPPPGTVLDVGGAAGAYAFWLAAVGYEVHLLDPVERLLEVARERDRAAGRPLASVDVGDARELPFPDASVEMVLLLGPLYHLPDPEHRSRAVEEALRVLRSGGHLFAACITRWASLLDGLTHDFLADPGFVEILQEDLRTGTHRNPDGTPGYFTTAYFHTPAEFETELSHPEGRLLGIFGLEGPARMLSDFDDRWRDPRRRGELLMAAEAVESEPSLMGLSPHLLGVVRKR
jgi:ubiquinone/menaquinone biosynthesis C-methylase UbiE